MEEQSYTEQTNETNKLVVTIPVPPMTRDGRRSETFLAGTRTNQEGRSLCDPKVGWRDQKAWLARLKRDATLFSSDERHGCVFEKLLFALTIATSSTANVTNENNDESSALAFGIFAEQVANHAVVESQNLQDNNSISIEHLRRGTRFRRMCLGKKATTRTRMAGRKHWKAS